MSHHTESPESVTNLRLAHLLQPAISSHSPFYTVYTPVTQHTLHWWLSHQLYSKNQLKFYFVSYPINWQTSSLFFSDSLEKLQSLGKGLSSKPLWKCHFNTRIKFTTCFKELQETPEASPTKASCLCHCPLTLFLTSKLPKVTVGGSEGLTSHQKHQKSSSTHHGI